MVSMRTYLTREEWLAGRTSRIGGSDAAAILGLSPWTSNVELWEYKTGRKVKEDISNKAAVKFGAEAEKYLREMFKLDFPELNVHYLENNMWVNDRYPFAHASLDGWLIDEDGRQGILEIKTANINSAASAAKWDKNRIPDYYYCQILHYFAVTDFDFAVLKARLRYDYGDELFCQVKHYRLEKSECEQDIDILMAEEEKFADLISRDIQPSLILPEI